MNKLLVSRLVALLVVALLGHGCAGFGAYNFAPIEARVVDEETGQPIEGAIVVANWQLEEASIHLTIQRESLEIQETVTNRDGQFKLPGFTKVNTTPYFLKSRAPQIIIFKPNYRIYYYSAMYPMGGKATEMNDYPKPAISGAPVKLKSLANEREKYLDQFRRLRMSLDSAFASSSVTGKACDWTKIPELLVAMEGEKYKLSYLDQVSQPRIADLLGRDCPSVPAALKELGISPESQNVTHR